MTYVKSHLRQPGAISRSRHKLEEMYRQLSLAALEREIGVRRKDPTYAWLRQYRNNPNGFIRQIVGPDWDTPTWKPWRAFINAVFALPFEDEDEERLYLECTHRTELPSAPAKEVWAPIGRRGGKSRVFAAIAVWLAVTQDWSPFLVKGEAGVIPILADAKDRAQQTMGYVKAYLAHPKLMPLVERDLSEEIYLKGNIIIRVGTASIKAVRSRTVLAALCDEIAFWSSDELGSNPDTEILAALRPAMLTTNGKLFCLSSPYARKGELWEQYKKHFGKNDTDVLVWQAPTRTMHPYEDDSTIDQQIKREYEKDPSRSSAEYGALFRTDVETILTHEVVNACVIPGRRELAPYGRIVYKAFVDPSGGSSDSMTLAIAHYDPDEKRAVLDLIRERKPPFSPEDVVKEFASLILSYGMVKVQGDRYAGEWPRERFALNGVTYEVSERNRSEIYQALIPLVNSAKVVLLDHVTLTTQLTSLERRTRSSARELIDHPPGGHDDVANAAAGVLVEVSYSGGEIWARPWSLPMPGKGLPTSGFAFAQSVNNRRNSRYMR